MLISEVMVPFYKRPLPLDPAWAVGVGLLLTVLMIVFSSNAVNLTDGLDGLAIGCHLIVSFAFLILTHIAEERQIRRLFAGCRTCLAPVN